MHLIEVKDPGSAKEFIYLPVKMYKKEPAYIRPLDKDIQSVFDPATNKLFRNGECTRWILKDGQGITIGRVAAFIDQKRVNKGNDQPTGAMGFFDCINDQTAAHYLMDQCKDWLEQRGMEAMDGPINFGERDRWWGCLVDGFDIEPNYCMPYNFPYYRELFESYGFREYFQQYTFARKVRDPSSPILQEKADRIFEDPSFSFRHMEKKKLAQYTEDFRTVYNKAWAGHGVPKMSSLQAKTIMAQIKPIMDERIIWFGYHNQDPICIYVNLPEVNQIFKHVNGKLDLLGKLKFLWHKIWRTNRKMFGVAFGVVPEYQGKGMEGALIESTRVEIVHRYPQYLDLEFNWIGDFNPKMIKVAKQVGCHLAKTHITYRKLFDETKPFKRARKLD